jgi:hypothetical protein
MNKKEIYERAAKNPFSSAFFFDCCACAILIFY